MTICLGIDQFLQEAFDFQALSFLVLNLLFVFQVNCPVASYE
jgi:hypothetical protein